MIDDIMEFAVEVVLDIIIEGSIQGAKSKKVPKFLRICFASIVIMFFIAVTALILLAAIVSESIPLTLLAAGVFIGFVYMFVKKYNEIKAKEDK